MNSLYQNHSMRYVDKKQIESSRENKRHDVYQLGQISTTHVPCISEFTPIVAIMPKLHSQLNLPRDTGRVHKTGFERRDTIGEQIELEKASWI